MTGNDRIEIAIEARDRRDVFDALCRELQVALNADERWERTSEVRAWQADAVRFGDLPDAAITAVLDEWHDSGDRVQAIEFSGLLATDDGYRAWGTITFRSGPRRAQERPVLERGELREAGGALTYRATIRMSYIGAGRHG